MPKHDKPIAADEPEDRELNIDPVVELTAETLRGDVRNSILDFIKAMPKSWAYMSEAERRDVANSLDRYSYTLVKESCKIIASRERPCIIGQLKEYREKDGVEAKLKFGSTEEVVTGLHGAVGQEVLLVTSGYDAFVAAREKPDDLVPSDQGDLGIGDEYRKGPEGDTDLLDAAGPDPDGE